jgi:hypothetical protein
MGYAMEYGKWDTRQADKQNRVAYGLYHYMGAKSKPASQPAASQATTTSQPTTASQPAKAPQ